MAKSPTLADLRTTYRVLSHIEEKVPQRLLVSLAEKIKLLESRKLSNRIAHMTEEDLIKFQETTKRRIRINLPDGRIIQEKTNEATFYTALIEADPSKVLPLNIVEKKQSLIISLPPERKFFPKYKFLIPGFFVSRSVKAEERLNILKRIDEALQLNWDIKLI